MKHQLRKWNATYLFVLFVFIQCFDRSVFDLESIFCYASELPVCLIDECKKRAQRAQFELSAQKDISLVIIYDMAVAFSVTDLLTV